MMKTKEKQMAKKFSDLRAQMSPEAQQSTEAVAQTMLAAMPLNELRQARGLSQKMLAEVLGDTLSPTGKYFLFVDNIDISKKYQCEYGCATFYILPIDESTVYNELLQLLYIDKGDLKKLDTAGKTDAVADKAASFSDSFPKISYEEGLALMGPVRNLYENRPV